MILLLTGCSESKKLSTNQSEDNNQIKYKSKDITINENLLKENISQILEADLKSREEKGSTIIKDLMLLHTKSKVIQNLTVGIIQLEKSLKVNEKEISTVLILLVPDKADEKALETMGVLSESIIENTNLLDILHQGSKAEIYLELEKIYTNYFKKKYKKVMEG